MIKFFLRSSYLFIFLLLFSCKKENKIENKAEIAINEKSDSIIEKEVILEKDTEIEIYKEDELFSFLNNYPVKNIPLVDSTSFNNFKLRKELNKKQIKLLQLNKIVPQSLKEYVNNFNLLYKLNLSNKFKTLIVCYYPNENELYTTLVNYDKEYNLIDWKNIAYDEIAESWFRTKSYINKETITVENISYVESNPKTETINYKISSDGKISRKK